MFKTIINLLTSINDHLAWNRKCQNAAAKRQEEVILALFGMFLEINDHLVVMLNKTGSPLEQIAQCKLTAKNQQVICEWLRLPPDVLKIHPTFFSILSSCPDQCRDGSQSLPKAAPEKEKEG